MKQKNELSSPTGLRELSPQSLQDRRKDKRVALNFAVEVSGFNRNGRLFSERAATRDVSASGCRLRIRTPLERGDVIAVRLLNGKAAGGVQDKPLLFQIAWIAREQEGWSAGALKLQPENIWHVVFPPPNQPEPPAA